MLNENLLWTACWKAIKIAVSPLQICIMKLVDCGSCLWEKSDSYMRIRTLTRSDVVVNVVMLRSMLWCCGRMLQCFGRILRCFEFAAENSLASLTLLKFYSVQSACHPRCNFLVIVVFSSADWREWGRQKCFGIYLRLNCASKWSRNILKL